MSGSDELQPIASDVEIDAPNDGHASLDSTKDQDTSPATVSSSLEGIDGAEEAAEADIRRSLISLGFICFDSTARDNAATGVLVAEERRKHFNRDVYVGIRDEEQGLEFLGRIVEGPFHLPHEISGDSAITRTTVLHPDRTRFRPSYYISGTIEVLGEIRGGEQIVPTATRPRPYSETYIFPADRLQTMLGIEGDFLIGELMGYQSVEVSADVSNKNFLPRNVGVFGTVGSGKSNTVQVLMEEAAKAGWAVVAVDVEGEYVQMDQETDDVRMAEILGDTFGLSPKGVEDLVVYVPSSGGSAASEAVPFKVPISQIDPGVIASILELSEPQERMFTIITSSLQRGSGATGASRQGAFGASQVGQGQRPYTLQNLIDGLEEDAAGNIPLLPRVQSAEKSTAYALRRKLIGLGLSGVLDWGATARVAELPVDDLLVGGRLSVLDVSETDDRSRSIAIAYMLQALFDRVIDTPVGEEVRTGQPRPKVLVVIEEVHTFVSRATAQRMRAVIDQLQVISRRGRKRWMSLALVSQQPGHVPDELFELVNTRFIHQLKSASNLAPVKQTTGGVHEALWSTVPALGPGQCLLSGAVFRNPIFATVRPARSKRLLTT